MLEKPLVVDALIVLLEEELALATNASRDAADYATNEESRAESQWDTQGLEASYLAAGQATHAKEIAEALHKLQGRRYELAQPCETVMRGALVQCQLGRAQEWFYFAPVAGGETVKVDGREVTVITRESPIAQVMVGKAVGDDFTLANGAPGKILQVR